MNNFFQVEPIGYFHSHASEKYALPRQPLPQVDNDGKIILSPHRHFEQALEGLEGFDRIWVIFLFHQNQKWKPKVMPPRGHQTRGVFATRSPHRPNFIGLSGVELIKIEGLHLYIKNHDLLDGTPILDVKPYVNYTDSLVAHRQGWLENLEEEKEYAVEWTARADQLKKYLQEAGVNLENALTLRFRTHPFPYPNNRIKHKENHTYELAYKTWRILYRIEKESVIVEDIYSGYDKATLEGVKPSQWDDVPLHQSYSVTFHRV